VQTSSGTHKDFGVPAVRRQPPRRWRVYPPSTTVAAIPEASVMRGDSRSATGWHGRHGRRAVPVGPLRGHFSWTHACHQGNRLVAGRNAHGRSPAVCDGQRAESARPPIFAFRSIRWGARCQIGAKCIAQRPRGKSSVAARDARDPVRGIEAVMADGNGHRLTRRR